MSYISKYFGKYSGHMKITVKLSLIAVAITFICLGVYRGEVESVFSKAINLCLECVGIG